MATRREFLQSLGAAALLVRAPRLVDARTGTRAGVRLGCAAITWGGDDERAIADVAALGYEGIQLRASAVAKWSDRPAELRDLLAKNGLTFVALSSGDVPLDAPEAEVLALHERNARFLKAAGGLHLQLIDKPAKGRPRAPEDYARMGRLLGAIGQRASDAGVVAVYHPHMGSLGEKPDEIDRVLAATDARQVRLLLDVAHWQAGGGDPVAAVRRYANRLQMLHIKDVRIPGAEGKPYQFVELGQGAVNLPAVFAALQAARFDGWGVVELDAVTEAGRTPKESNAASLRYLQRTLTQAGSPRNF